MFYAIIIFMMGTNEHFVSNHFTQIYFMKDFGSCEYFVEEVSKKHPNVVRGYCLKSGISHDIQLDNEDY